MEHSHRSRAHGRCREVRPKYSTSESTTTHASAIGSVSDHDFDEFDAFLNAASPKPRVECSGSSPILSKAASSPEFSLGDQTERKTGRPVKKHRKATPVNVVDIHRRLSMPEDQHDQVRFQENVAYKVRHLTITKSGGVVSKGETTKNKSVISVSSTGHFGSVFDENADIKHHTELPSRAQPEKKFADDRVYKVVMLGEIGVGRMSLTRQFMTSESLGPVLDQYFGDEDCEMTVTVLLDGEESQLIFISANTDRCHDLDVDAYVVVYAVTDKHSFKSAADLIIRLRKEKKYKGAIILVGNKSDLARSRTVDMEDGKSVATAYDCKFVETSVVLHHQVDELLVGILRQIRLKEKKEGRHAHAHSSASTDSSKQKLKSKKAARGFLKRLFRRSSDTQIPSSGVNASNLYE